jgi:nitrite reductase (NADH) large subunit
MSEKPRAWRCTVCGYIHAQIEAPDCCPVCGADQADFEPYSPPAPTPPAPIRAQRWQCVTCDYIHEGPEPPGTCPLCGVNRDQFQPLPEGDPVGTDSGTPAQILIVGGGISGVSAAETIRRVSPQSSITLVGTEGELPYYRLNLTRYLAGEIPREALPIHPAAWFENQHIGLIRNVNVDRINAEAHSVTLSNGLELPYDRLILAAGSHAYIPSLEGVHLEGVFTLRTTVDADHLIHCAQAGTRCVCIGGGILGIEIAGALARQKVAVTLLESHAWLMPRQLNLRAAGVLERHLLSLGIQVVKKAQTRALIGETRVSGVVLQDGPILPADMVVLATGVRPNTALARKAGLEVNNGVVVDNHLRTSLPDIFAAGDAAEHNGQVYGAWAASQYQGTIAALNAVGIPTAFGGLPRSNTVKALGLDLTSIGKFQPEDGSYTVLEQEGTADYITFVFHDSRLAGAILIGHADLAATVKKAVESKTDFSALLQKNPAIPDILTALRPA